MRLHTLELTGFGPFRDTQRIDFDAFAGDGLFLISGRTGTGKSSILDGVSFALYGTVPRYDGVEKRLRSDHSAPGDPTEVRLEFTLGDTRWRVTRAPEYDRPAKRTGGKRGGGLTTEPARAVLEERVGEEWIGRAAKPRTVGEALGEILGLNAQQFQQVILLAQNKFSRFLLASGDERQALLRTLFGTRRFEQYRDALDERRKDAQRRLDTAGERTRTLTELALRLVAEHDLGGGGGTGAMTAEAAAAADELLAAQARADYRVEQAATAREQAGAAASAASRHLAERTERAQRARERAALRARLAALDAREPAISEDRSRLASARTAETLRATLDVVDRATAAHDAAAQVADRAEQEWAAYGGAAVADGPGDVSNIDLGERIDALTADVARWDAAAALEREQSERAERLESLAAALVALDAEIADVDGRLAAAPDERGALESATAAARAVAARRDDLRARRAELDARLAAAREAARLSERSVAAERTYLDTRVAADAAAAAVTTLLARRLAGHAGELSAALVDGEPCAVCGSTVHPAPAPSSDDPITDDALAAAEAEREGAQRGAVDAADAARVAREALAAARASAGDQSETELVAALADVTSQADAADAAADELTALTDRLAALDRRIDAARTERDDLVAQRARLGEEHAATRSASSDAARTIAAACGDFSSVAARIAAATEERDRARTLAAARESRDERARALRAAEEDARVGVAAAGHSCAADARAALLSPDERDALDARITAHAADLAGTRERLLELELVLTDDDPTEADLDVASAVAREADTARTAAIAAHFDAESVAARLRDLAQQVDDASAALSGLADDAAAAIRLADTVAGRAPNTMRMDLETFVLAAELEEIVAAANLRLAEMSSGRYSLHHSDARAARGRASGLGIEVLDAYTGRMRSPQSLSGGETFLASLSLALGLGEVVTSRAGGIRLDTLFVDEGFGSLDPETLDLAMRTLDELRAGGRTVGLISHVEAMKEQIPAQLAVEAVAEGPSVIRQDAAVANVV